jgi:DNA invertase Pin-like site-specific DNA recombinase
MGNATIVYSYRRFSSGRQAKGHSLERQTELARRWCAEKGYVLDETLALADLGISAYSGHNASRGALAAFLQAAKTGRVQKGAILLVESLDRLSRAALPEAINLLTDIVKTGVRVVSLIDGHEWNEKTINDTTSFMLSVLLFSRAHEESSTKADRVSEQFQKKRAAKLPVVSNGHGPGWASPLEDRSGWQLDRARAAAVERVFQLAALGRGGIAIARLANEQGWVQPWRVRKNTSTRWEHTGVSRLLRDRRVLGEWQPKRMIAGVLTPDGDPVQNYFPRIVSDDLWHRVQNALNTRDGPKRIRGVKADMFGGLFYCACGERMERKAATSRGYARYYCLGRKHGTTDCSPVAEKLVVHCVISMMAQVEQSAFNPDSSIDKIREELATNKSRLTDLKDRAARLVQAIEESGGSSSLLSRLAVLEKEENTINAAISAAESLLAAVPLQGWDFGKELAARAAKAANDKSDVEGRHRVATALQRTVKRIVWHQPGYFMIHGTSGVSFAAVPPAELVGRAKNRNAGKPRVAPTADRPGAAC